MTPKQQHASLKIAVKRAIVVLDTLGDNEMRFQNMGQVWNRATADASLAYGYNETRVRIVPTAREIAQAETVADWLAWLGTAEGPFSVPRLVSWSHDDPIWRIAERERCSERTIHNRIDRSIAAILLEFGGETVDVPEVDEAPAKAHLPNFMTERPTVGPTQAVNQHGKCWIDGVGFMKDGKRLRTGYEKAERFLRQANAH